MAKRVRINVIVVPEKKKKKKKKKKLSNHGSDETAMNQKYLISIFIYQQCVIFYLLYCNVHPNKMGKMPPWI